MTILAIVLACLSGCREGLPPEKFVTAYEKAALQTIDMGDYRIRLLYQSPEYVLARELRNGAPPAEAQALSHRYGEAIFVTVSISPKEISGTPEDISKDFLNASLLAGEDQFRAKLDYLQAGLRGKVRLEDSKKHVLPPSTYSFTRNFGMGRENTFLFAFPRRSEGRKWDMKDAELVIDDFGLNAGTIRTRLKSPGSLALRVTHE